MSLAQGAVVQPAQVQAEPVSSGVGAHGAGNAPSTQAVPAQLVQPKRPAHYLWAVLIARIYEVLALLWDECDAQGGEGMEPVPDWDEAAQLVPDFEVDQRISW